ncbi:hypothetical protein CLCR_03167 [Cladophialophora carrionii]|uniref:Uncharacterized protein n=1 Tax=Cladophialophora carrionii TaxID=86049 RepID=A0A1C1D2B8_9EURO|nr:hypothetical protein CLCR_03167 [Cladophialophora carrionii]
MLDDFKTELKRLNVKRVRKEEMRRQTFALVDDLHDPKYGDDHHMEFTDALNTSPLRFQTMQNLDHSPGHSPMGRPRQDSVADSQTNEKEAIGKAGKKISKLPAFKDFAFASGGRKKARIPDLEGDARTDASQPPTQPQASDRLADMRRSLGVIDYHTN